MEIYIAMPAEIHMMFHFHLVMIYTFYISRNFEK